jgi:hypothetical protein
VLGPGAEQLLGKPPCTMHSDKEPGDKGKPTVVRSRLKWLRPLSFVGVAVIGNCSDKSAMKTRNSGEIPGARGERTRQETAGVVDEVGDNHVDNPLRKPSGRDRVDDLRTKLSGRDCVDEILKKFSGIGRVCGRGLRRGILKGSFFCPSGSASVPDTFSKQSNCYSGKTTRYNG